MKRTYLFICSFLMSFSFAWAQNCTQPMANFQFQQQKNNINSQFNESQRLMAGKQLLDRNCLTASQVKELCELMGNDFNKLDFAKSAYPRTTDQANFYEVYNGFSQFSTVFMLHDFVLEQRGGNINGGGGNNTLPPTSITFPNLNYPSSLGYNGARRCDFALAENAFMPLAQDVRAQFDENAKVNRLDQIISQQCMTTSQIMRFATLLSDDNNRLSFLKKAHLRVFDLANYNQAVQVLQFQQNQNSFMTFIGGGNNPNNPINPPVGNCTVTQADMADMKQRVQKESFDNSRLNMAKTIARVKKCYTSAQVKDIATWFTFSDSKMNIAQFMYDFTTDRENYYTVVDAFTLTSDRDKFMAFVNSKK